MKRRALKKRYGHAASSKKQFTDIRHGYRVTDTMATDLARDSGRMTPLSEMGHHYEWSIHLPNGAKGWLARTPVTTDVYGFKPPKRGWVWYVRPTSQPEGNEQKFYEYVRER